MAKHYAKKGKTKIDPIFDTLTEIDSLDERSITNAEIQRSDTKLQEQANQRGTTSSTES